MWNLACNNSDLVYSTVQYSTYVTTRGCTNVCRLPTCVYYSVCIIAQNVTQGARKKIMLSICRLNKRPETLLEIEQVSQ